VKEETMMTRILRSIFAAAVAVCLVAAPTAAGAATAKKEETKKETTKKELSPQQQKMKDCAAKWGDEKKAKKVSGKKAHNEFMSTCLKG
jgi:Ni/Co efflux regulator RcnB